MDLVVDASVWLAGAIPTEPTHRESVAFLSRSAKSGGRLHVPSIARIEVACAFARRFGDATGAIRLTATLLGRVTVSIHPIDDQLIANAIRVGASVRLRGADAIYAALAQGNGWPLVTWDQELIQRAGAITPDAWTP